MKCENSYTRGNLRYLTIACVMQDNRVIPTIMVNKINIYTVYNIAVVHNSPAKCSSKRKFQNRNHTFFSLDANNKGADQTEHMRCLNNTFAAFFTRVNPLIFVIYTKFWLIIISAQKKNFPGPRFRAKHAHRLSSDSVFTHLCYPFIMRLPTVNTSQYQLAYSTFNGCDQRTLEERTTLLRHFIANSMLSSTSRTQIYTFLFPC